MKKSLYKRFIEFYKSSAEHRMQIHVFIGFAVLPIIGLIVTYVTMYQLFIKE